MAKQRVSFVEEHLEKGAVGLAGAALLGVAFLYLFQSPNAIEEDGKKYGPSDYDKVVLLAKVERLKRGIRNEPPAQEPVPDYARRFQRKHASPIADDRVARNWPGIQPWRPDVPPAVGIKPRAPNQILLTQVLPPEKPVVYAGLTTIKVQQPQAIDSEDDLSDEEWEDLLEKDRSWVTVAAKFDLEEQEEEFRRAEYDLELRDIHICRVRLQRQQLLEGGQWDAWENVETWAPYRPVEPPELELSRQSEGLGLTKNQIGQLNAYLDLIRLFQPEIKTPYPPVGIAGTKWRLPRLPGIDWCTLDLNPNDADPNRDEEECNPYYDELPKPPDAESSRKQDRPLTPAQQKSKNRVKAAKQLKEIEELIKVGTLESLLKAEKLIHEILKNPDAARRIKNRANKFLARILPDLDELEQNQAKGRQDAPAGQVAVQEQTHTAVWAHDLPVKPGHTYRYRLAVDLYNTYVNRYDKLQDTEAASSAAVLGEWSEPSDPISVAPESAFFVSRVDGSDVRIEIYKWFRGHVFNQKIEIQPGQRIADRDFVKIPGQSGRFVLDYDTGYTLLSGDDARPVRVRDTVGRTGAFEYRQESAPTIYAVDAEGNIVERNKLLDQTDQRVWAKK